MAATMAPITTVLFPIVSVFSRAQAMFNGPEEGHEATTQTAKYLIRNKS